MKKKPAPQNLERIRAILKAAPGLAENQDFKLANKVLDELEDLLDQALMTEDERSELDGLQRDEAKGSVDQVPPPPPPPNPSAEAWKLKRAEVQKWMPAALRADAGLADLCKKVFSQGDAFAKAQKYEEAVKLVDGLAVRLRQAIDSARDDRSTESDGPVSRDAPRVAYTKSRLEWDSTRKEIHRQLKELQSALTDVDGALAKKLDGSLEKFDEALMDSLDFALNADSDVDRRKHEQESLEHIQRYKQELSGNALIQHFDANPFGLRTNIEATLTRSLNALERQLHQLLALGAEVKQE